MRLGVGAVFDGTAFIPGDIEIAEGRVTGLGLSPGGPGLAVPGYVDLQVNGFGGVDFQTCGPEGYREAGPALAATGVTAFQPTLITAPVDDLVERLGSIGGAQRREGGPVILGAHLEGPFLSPDRAGVHPVEHLLEPDPAVLDRLLAAGPVTHVTMAPELPGALEMVGRLVDRGVRVSFGHTDAGAETAHRGFDAGAVAVTHLFNAMRPFTPRDPGLAGAALARAGIVVTIIADGVHLAPDTVRLVAASARGRAAVVTDAIAAAAAGDGPYRLGGIDIDVVDGVATRPDGRLAGATGGLDQAVRNLITWGVPVSEALASATSVPGRLTGTGAGVLEVGGRADVVVLDDRFEVVRVLIGGADRSFGGGWDS
jgi:N-acetylglucosamine-6-phosphate deacetylase